MIEPNISAWRRNTVGDLTSAFRFAHGIRPYPADPRLRYAATTASLLVAQREAQNKPAPMSPTGKAAVAQHRRALRKLPSTTLH